MKNKKISSYKALSLIFTILSTGAIHLDAQSLLMGTIQFSKNSTVLPIHIHCGGTQVTTAIHEAISPKITFEITKANDQTRFYVLITPLNVSGKLKDNPNKDIFQNTVEYLTINPEAPYTFYVLDLVKKEEDAPYQWEIKTEELPATGQIPDRTIIVECYPDWIKDFKGGSAVELPTLFVENALELAQSEEKFTEDLIKLQLTALESNTIHAPTRRKIKTTGQRILIMDLIT